MSDGRRCGRDCDGATFCSVGDDYFAERADDQSGGFFGGGFESGLGGAGYRADWSGDGGPAEIVAAQFPDNNRGETVGDRTYGTASMQKLIEMDDGSALILTVANYYTPDNKEIPANGVARYQRGSSFDR